MCTILTTFFTIVTHSRGGDFPTEQISLGWQSFLTGTPHKIFYFTGHYLTRSPSLELVFVLCQLYLTRTGILIVQSIGLME